MNDVHPVRFSVDYPDRDLNRVSTGFRIFTVIPIAIVIGTIGGYSARWGTSTTGTSEVAIGGTGLLFIPPLLMILFRQNRYPSTDDEQSVHLEFSYPDAQVDLNRWLPLVKWFLAIPHYIVLFFLYIGVVFAAIGAWFAILFTGRYPRGIFDYIEGVIRWHNRVVGYAIILITDRYPPFALSQ